MQLRVQERDVERRVVNDQLRAADELDQLVDDVGEARLLREEFVGDAVHLLRAAVDFAVGPQVTMERAAGLAPIDQLDAADFDDAMALLRLEARGFGVEDDLAHDARSDRCAQRLHDAGLLIFGQVRMHRQAEHAPAAASDTGNAPAPCPRSANTGCRCSGTG